MHMLHNDGILDFITHHTTKSQVHTEHPSACAHSTLFLFLFLFLFHLSTIIVVLLYTSVDHNYGSKNGDDMDDNTHMGHEQW